MVIAANPDSGRVVYNSLAADFPAPLRDHCLRQLIALTHNLSDYASGSDSDGDSSDGSVG